jgi:hypothetical protein
VTSANNLGRHDKAGLGGQARPRDRSPSLYATSHHTPSKNTNKPSRIPAAHISPPPNITLAPTHHQFMKQRK